MVLAGQIFGWLAAILTFSSYQFKEHKRLIVIQTLSCVSICISYLFLGAHSGMLLNIVCIVRNLIINKRNIKFFSYSFWPYLLALVMAFVGALSWQGYMSLLVIVALTVNTLFLYFPNVQTLRKSVLVTSTLIMLYDVYFEVWGGVANELIAVTSSLIGIYRYRKIK